MKRLILALLLILIPVSAAQAAPRPTIITFRADLLSITVNTAELGATSTSLSWHVVNLGPEHRLALETYRVNRWESVLADDETLDANDRYALIVEHPANFAPPTYRLSILGLSGNVIDERSLSITYDVADLTPTIDVFDTPDAHVDADALAAGDARVSVSWSIIERVPTANPVFEQVLDDGSVIPVELPRDELWVASTGTGMVAPVLPSDDGVFIRLRLRLLDVVSDELYDEAELLIPIVGRSAADMDSEEMPVLLWDR